EADGVSADGSFIVGCLDTQHSYVWNQSSGVQPLPDFGGLPGLNFYGNPYGISSNGEIIVGAYHDMSSGNFPGTAICWIATNKPIAVIDGQPWGNTAVAISDDGSVITGRTITNGLSYGFRWTATSGVELLTDASGEIQNSF